MGKIKEAINNMDEIYAAVEEIKAHNDISIRRIKMQKECPHENVEHQKAEYDTNVPEAYTCKDCGMDLDPPPESDWDLLAKEQNI